MSISPSPDTGINNLINFMNISSSQVQLIIVVGIVITMFIVVGYILKRKKR